MKSLTVAALVLLGTGVAHLQDEPADRATLVVSEAGSGPDYIEGYVAFFQVYSDRRKVDGKRLRDKTACFTLPSGKYDLVSYLRPCDGNCGFLDPPSDECRASFSIKAKEILYAVRENARRSCKLRFSSNA